jgi:hypothetical protein
MPTPAAPDAGVGFCATLVESSETVGLSEVTVGVESVTLRPELPPVGVASLPERSTACEFTLGVPASRLTLGLVLPVTFAAAVRSTRDCKLASRFLVDFQTARFTLRRVVPVTFTLLEMSAGDGEVVGVGFVVAVPTSRLTLGLVLPRRGTLVVAVTSAGAGKVGICCPTSWLPFASFP